MLNIYLRLVVLAAIVLAVLGAVVFIIPLLIKAALLAAVVLGVLFLINFFRRRSGALTGTFPGLR
ncbi:MAG: hypothetical protein ABR508_03245 [Candidatus Baltobacteraceae bacterium]